MLYLFADTVKPVAKALKNNDKKVFTYRWAWRGKPFQKLFGWIPKEPVGIEKIANDIGIPAKLDEITEKTVGGLFCRRASEFGDFAIPSSVALHHSAVRVTLIYEFAVKMLKLRGQRHSSSTRDQPRHDSDGRDRRH